MKKTPLSICFENPNRPQDTARFLVHLCAEIACNREKDRPAPDKGTFEQE